MLGRQVPPTAGAAQGGRLDLELPIDGRYVLLAAYIAARHATGDGKCAGCSPVPPAAQTTLFGPTAGSLQEQGASAAGARKRKASACRGVQARSRAVRPAAVRTLSGLF